jgi:hypothetical protein
MNIALVNVTYALFLAFLTERLVEHFVGKPLEEKAPLLDRWWLIYVALGVGGAICWFAGLNIFGALMPDLLGRILTCLIVGGGSELLHAIVNWVSELASRASYSCR